MRFGMGEARGALAVSRAHARPAPADSRWRDSWRATSASRTAARADRALRDGLSRLVVDVINARRRGFRSLASRVLPADEN
jgi:hypothetical protein